MNLIIELLACILVSLAFKFLSGGGLHLEVMGATLYLLMRNTWLVTVQPGRELLKSLSAERITFNLSVSAIKPPKIYPFVWKAIFIGLIFASITIAGLGPKSLSLLAELKASLAPRYVNLQLSFPSYQGKKPQLFSYEVGKNLKEQPSEIILEGSTLLEISLSGPLRNEQVQFSLDLNKPNSQKPPAVVTLLNHNQPIILSADSLKQKWEDWDSKSPQSLTLHLQVANAADFASVPLVVRPLETPQVELRANTTQPTEGDVPAGAVLGFEVKVTGSIPLTQIELQARTKSNYRFTKALGEFANSEETSFQNSSIQLPLVGIPFAPNDSLFVKAVAKTMVPGLVGESIEIEFKVKSKQDIRKEIMDHLALSLEQLEKLNPKDFNELKSNILRNLQSAKDLAPQLGQRHPLVRRLPQAQKSAEEMNSKGDNAWRETKRKIEAALELLKKDQKSESTPQLMARLQNYKQSLEKSSTEDKELLKMSQELEKDVEAAKNELDNMAKSGEIGLTAKERENVEELLRKDSTAEKIRQSGQELKNNQRNKASTSAGEALESATRNLAQALQTLQAARMRDMEDARKRLTEADAKLQDAKNESNEGQSAQQKIGEAGESLAKSPRISKEFNEALAKAKQGQMDAQNKAQKGDKSGTKTSIEASQDGIVKALEALQDEQSAEQESKRDSDGSQSRSAMDYLSAQGSVDVGWRKTILDEMARLKSAGEPSNSPLLQYLESRLR